MQGVGEIISGLYAAATGRDSWSGVMQQAARTFDCQHGILGAHARWSTPAVLAVSTGLDPSAEARFVSIEGNELMRPLLEPAPTGIAFDTGALIADRAFERTPYYNEIVRPADGFRSLCARPDAAKHIAFASFCRARNARRFTSDEVAAFQTLVPHFGMAVELTLRLRRLEHASRVLSDALENVCGGVLLVDAQSRVLWSNRNAQVLLARGDGLSSGATGLVAAGALRTQQIRALVVRTAADGIASKSTVTKRLILPRPSLRAPLLVTAVPSRQWEPGGDPNVVLFVDEPDAHARVDVDLIAESFRLTPREAALGALISAGYNLKSAAGMLGMGIGTARGHLKHLFQKTRTHDRTGLALLLRGFAGS